MLAGELVSPPAGAIGRGDAFVLQIADKADAVILSNDSFQEFHGQYPWLFDEGRLIGGKPVPGLGWVFLLRTPVRGPASRRSVKEARTGRPPAAERATSTPRRAAGPGAGAARAGQGEPVAAPAAPSGQPGGRRGAKRRRRRSRQARSGADAGRQAAQRSTSCCPSSTSCGAHPVGSEVEATVDSFSSHGAYATRRRRALLRATQVDGRSAPLRARDVLDVGETRRFTVSSIDAPRRGIDLAPRRPIAIPPLDLVTVPLPQGVPIGTVARQVDRAASAESHHYAGRHCYTFT